MTAFVYFYSTDCSNFFILFYFFKSKKNETGVAYCGLSTAKKTNIALHRKVIHLIWRQILNTSSPLTTNEGTEGEDLRVGI